MRRAKPQQWLLTGWQIRGPGCFADLLEGGARSRSRWSNLDGTAMEMRTSSLTVLEMVADLQYATIISTV